MDTGKLKRVAQEARTLLIAQVTSKLGLVLAEGSAARREVPEAVRELEREIARTSRSEVIEKVAYTWFNRFTALRFMDANGYTNLRIVTPAEGQMTPEILSDAKAGHFDDLVPEPTRTAVQALLDGRTPSRDAQGEAYRLLLVAACNHWHGPMPFLFEKIADYTELLMPEDLLSESGILARLRTAMTEADCQDVEVIGWLYQFYISEKKDQVFAAMKKNVKITAENIPAATQLFTPHWIVRYLVENSLGRLWLLNHPQSRLAERMDYYIAPEEPETDFLRVERPEEIRICDPACGSGHMLTYAFDLLYAIYEEEGHEPSEIPGLILTHNLFGIEIDDRAGALAAFALAMKAAQKLGRRRFLRMSARPQICVLVDVGFTEAELRDYMAAVGRDLFTADLRETLGQFSQAKNFGSLIVPKLKDPAEIAQVIASKDLGSNLFLRDVHKRVQAVLRMAEFLSTRYHVVVANPPYMGARGMSERLANWLKVSYADAKSDLFSAFILRCGEIVMPKGHYGLMSPNVWLYISSFEKLRALLLAEKRVTNLVELPLSGFKGATVQICAFNLVNRSVGSDKGTYIRLVDFKGGDEEMSEFTREAVKGRNCRWLHRASSSDFISIPGVPLAYWVSDNQRKAFTKFPYLGSWAPVKQGLATANNEKFVRRWHEVSTARTGLDYQDTAQTKGGTHRWFPYNKGGDYRRWYGNAENVVNWESDGRDIRNFCDDTGYIRSRAQNTEYYFKKGVTWTFISSSNFGVRMSPNGYVFDVAGSSAFPSKASPEKLTAFLASKVAWGFLKMLNPTMNFQVGNIASLPVDPGLLANIPEAISTNLITHSKSDWDAFETSWDFTALPLVAPEHRAETLEETWANLRTHWRSMTEEMQGLEEENNRIFIDAYGLQDELTPEVPLEEITLTCNPSFRYGAKVAEAEREARLLEDTVQEFLHYAVGCMFGRYSLDAPGLILANQGERLEDYLARVPQPSFMPDRDNVIPVLEGDWFADDITERFRKFLRVTFGEARFQENLAFIEAALGKDVRRWFTRDLFDYHVRRYKKRPIYWMVSSPKGSFNALIYMHRYRPETASILLNDYLRELITKLQAERGRLDKLADDPGASQSQRTKALKEVGLLAKQIDELTAWERDVVFPLAQARLEIDLDDGVKANYPKFGAALKPIKGLEVVDE
ncbi:BREX-1 system adenine-specific DNA-methyltransferase PglX [Rubellimicrobium rubrum]|uniref:site-specific DNA-methyltransferase (adenine-specific) n=1 Tax=Rubellimicrobium rubrum TaxID=2585369 RepID=A0A5C4MVB9_9RHOB|nr:BREX-1 system adenine-specific DNA-methyltransferase PglX [Rubellimicrobium rubrum]TNC49325.1 BREX-1 system adenine-specific DNA-methyltransferase PglX [Rubellimicrobium rubrum]